MRRTVDGAAGVLVPPANSVVSPLLSVDLGPTFGGRIAGVAQGGAEPIGELRDLDAGFLTSVGIEWSNGGRLWYGPGLTFFKLVDPFGLDQSGRTVTSLDFRGRAAVAIWGRWGAELAATVGLASWADDGQGRLIGWAYRLGGGVKYELQPGFDASVGLSHWRSDVGSRDGLLEDTYSGRQPLAASTWVLTLGLRLR